MRRALPRNRHDVNDRLVLPRLGGSLMATRSGRRNAVIVVAADWRHPVSITRAYSYRPPQHGIMRPLSIEE